MPRRAAAVLAVQEVMHAPIRLGQLAAHLVNRAVPRGVMPQNRRRQDDLRVRILRPNRANPPRVSAPPVLRGVAVVVLRHEIDRVRVVLPNRNDDDVRRVAAEIPVGFRAERRIVVNLVPRREHPDVVRAEEIAGSILQRHAAGRNVVQLRAKQTRRLPRVAQVAVAVPPVVPFGVYLPAGKFRFGHLPGGHAVPVNLHAALRARRQGQQLRIFLDGEPMQHQRMAAILPFEEQHMVFAV